MAATIMLTCAGLVACSTDDGRTLQPPAASQTDSVASPTTVGAVIDQGSGMTVNGPWASGTEIDPRYTCDGEGISPSLTWTPGPEGTQAYAITITSMDTDATPHWVVTNIDFSATTSPEGSVPAGGVVAANASGTRTYTAPCPAPGSTTTHVVTVYALDALTPLDDDPDARTMMADIESAALEAATTVFTVTR